MAKDHEPSLLDQLIEDTERAHEGKPAAPEPEAAPPPGAEPEIETRPRRWAMDPDVRDDLCGMVKGSRFEMSDCGEELDGVWRVVQLNLSHPSPFERHLYAEREAGGPPFIKMAEDAIREEIAEGRLKILG